MKRVLLLAFAMGTLLLGSSTFACERHLSGHQNGSDTASETNQK